MRTSAIRIHYPCVDFLSANDSEFKITRSAVSMNSVAVRADDKKWQEFSAKLFYHQGDFLKAETFSTLKSRLTLSTSKTVNGVYGCFTMLSLHVL